MSSNPKVVNDITLTFPSDGATTSRTLSLDFLLNQWLAPEIMKDRNAYNCETCAFQTATKYQVITAAPAHLMVSLSRFYFNVASGRNDQKINDPVAFPIIYHLPIELKHKTAAADDVERPRERCYIPYELCGIILHRGNNARSGHYYAYGRATDNDESSAGPPSRKWRRYDDQDVLEISTAQIEAIGNTGCCPLSGTPYILFYRRLGEDAEYSDNDEVKAALSGSEEEEQEEEQEEKHNNSNDSDDGDTEMMKEGDVVNWTRDDGEVPNGTEGTVVGFSADGVHVAFPSFGVFSIDGTGKMVASMGFADSNDGGGSNSDEGYTCYFEEGVMDHFIEPPKMA